MSQPLDALAPAERLAFVPHDMFDVPFDEIAPIVRRSPAATRQLASRARRRVQGTATVPDTDLARQREVVGAFLAASRGGEFDALVALLDPDVVLVNGVAGAVWVHGGQPRVVFGFTITRGKIAEISLFADPAQLRQLDLVIPGD